MDHHSVHMHTHSRGKPFTCTPLSPEYRGFRARRRSFSTFSLIYLCCVYQYIDASVLDISCTIVGLGARTVFLFVSSPAQGRFAFILEVSRRPQRLGSFCFSNVSFCDWWQTCGMKEAPGEGEGEGDPPTSSSFWTLLRGH